MLKKGISKYIYNPVFGFIPFVVYIILHALDAVGEIQALTIALGLAFVLELMVRLRYKTKMFSLTFYTTIIAFVTTILFFLVTRSLLHSVCIYVIFCEIMIVVILLIIRVSKIYIGTIFFRQKNVLQKALLNEFYHVASMIQYGLMTHLFIFLIYINFRIIGEAYNWADMLMVVILPIAILLGIGAYNIVRTTSLASRLRREEWLPIVTERGEVTGKIAKSVSLRMKNKFLHPVIRVALVCDDRLYLQERKSNDILDAGKLDYPFEKYMLFNHEINLAARNSISQMLGNKMNIPLKFLLKYVLENDETKRLILLFVATVEDEALIRKSTKMNGKFWTVKQIEESFADEVFSESFELEFEYLKNTILQPID